jgi:hypothetical protein
MNGDRATTGRLITRVAPLALSAFVGFLPGVAAGQQVQNVTPYYAFVTAEKAAARCGSNQFSYTVADLTSGQIVFVDGEGEAWSRISCPPNMTAFVRVEDVQVEGTTAKVTQPTRLKAASATAGYSGSWQLLLANPLPAGASLTITEPIKEGDGPVIAYRVATPEGARAYLESRHLRRATPGEVDAYRTKAGGLAPLPLAAGGTPAPTTTAANPLKPGPQPTPPSTSATPPTSITLAEPMAPGSGTPPAPGTAEPAPVSAPAAQEPAKTRALATSEQLEATFLAIWKQPPETAELGELVSEFNRAIASETDDVRRKTMQSRVEALKLRIDLVERMREREQDKTALDAQKSQIAEQVAAWERTRVYTIVGQLAPSTVYDGKRLPLMFRVVSVGGTSPRTLGYLKSTTETDLTKMLGQVVGVIGESTLDRSLMLNIISPIKVDVLKGGPQVTTPTAAAEEEDDGKGGGGY